jgi:hypothetical protein
MADKLTLIHALQARREHWHALKELVAVVPGVPERTLRHWLASLVAEGKVTRSGEKKGARYRWIGREEPATVHPASSSTQNAVFTATSRKLLERIEAPLYTRPPVTYSKGWVDSYRPNETFYLSANQRDLLHAQGKRLGIQARAGTYIQKIFNRLLIDLSYNSARLEGNTYSMADTERLLLEGVGAVGKAREERIMILNHKEAIRYLVDNADRLSMTEETIRTLHYLLASDLVAPQMAGQIRDESIRVSATTYAPLEGRERLASLLASLLEKARSIDDPFEQSLFILGHVAYLQPFVDVNKRTARLASIIPIVTRDYVPQSFIDVAKDDYLKAVVCFYELNEAGPLADLYCWSYERACQHYDTSVQVVGFDEIAALYRPQRRALVSDIVRAMVPPPAVAAYVQENAPTEIASEHRTKFLQDVRSELENLDVTRMAGLGLERQQVEAWLKLRRQ